MSNIVVGSGISGMSIALLLAQQNQEVTIIEAAPKPAPLIRGFERSSLFFDTGFHCAGGLAPNGVLHRWLDALGVWKYIGYDSLQFIDEEFRFSSKEKYYFPAQEEKLLAAISEQFQEQECFEKFLCIMKNIVSYSPYINPLQKNTIQDIKDTVKSLPEILSSLPFSQSLKQIIMARCLLIGLKPHDTSFEHYSLLSAPYFESCATLKGGGKKIKDAYLHALNDAGISIQCNSKLESLLLEDGTLKGIKLTSGKELPCKNCFFTGHPQQLKSIVPPSVFRPAFFNRIEDMKETPHAFMVFGETKSDILYNKVIYLLSKDNMDIIIPLDCAEPSVYVSGGEPINGRYPVTVIATIKHDKYTNNDSCYNEWKQDCSKKLIQHVEKLIPELAPIHILDSSSPSTLRHWIYGSTGSLYGIAHTNDTIPLLHITRLKGFFMAGQNILLPGMLGAIVSAAICTGFAFGHEKILQGFRR